MGTSYERVRAWRASHRDEARRQDRVYKLLMRKGPWRDAWLRVLDHYAPASRCLCCGRRAALVPDHITPVAQGGDNWAGNLQPLCRPCNAAKKGVVRDHRPDLGQAFAAEPRWLSQGPGRKPVLAAS